MLFNFILNSTVTKLLKMSIFTQRLNPITGQMAWVIQSENYDFHQEVARAAYGDMLHDYERNQKYEAALKIAIDHMHSRGKKANVLDIGTGTGLLSMMAVRHGADSVVACEAFKPMSECAKKVIESNGYADKITIIPKRSTEIKVGPTEDMKLRANILVTEVFDTELIGEGAFSTFKGAHDDLLEKDCIVIPHAATMFAQVVESPFVQNWNRLKDIYDEDGKLLLKAPASINACRGSAAVHDIQLSNVGHERFNSIIPPQPVFKFDWSGKTPLVFDRTDLQIVKAERDGIAHAVFMWWELDMDIHSEIKINCAPYWGHPEGKKAPWRDHWMQAIYYLPNDVKVWKDESLKLISCHDEYSLWFNLKKDSDITDVDYLKPECDCSLHLFFSRTRIGQMNDSVRTKKFVSLLERHITKESVVLVLSNGCYVGLVAAKLGAKKVVFVEPEWVRTGRGSKNIIQSFVEENALENVEVVDAEGLKELSPLKFNIVFGEPFFNTCILPSDNLQFVYQCDEFKEMFNDDVKIFPKKAIVKGVAVQFRDLYKIRSPLGVCEGFKMDSFDSLIQMSSNIVDDIVEAEPLWEYPGHALSDAVDVATLDLSSLSSQDIAFTGTLNMQGSGHCNGVALWVDWIMDEDENIVVSTGPIEPVQIDEEIKWNIHIRQGVHLMKPRESPGIMEFSFKFEQKLGVIRFKFN